MALYLDLSSGNLDPQSVVGFVGALKANRPSEDVLLKVSRRAHQLACARGRTKGVKVSQSELRKINRFLHRSLKADAFVLRRTIKCRKCSRTLTFYDFFESGRDMHGDEHMAKYLSAGGYHVHIQKRGRSFAIKCSDCNTKNVVSRLGYDGPQY